MRAFLRREVNVPDRVTQERIAKNDSLFREANERIESVAEEQKLTVSPVPFICECADLQCTQITSLTLEEYWYVRSNPRWFINAPGHESAGLGAVAVVEDHRSYVIVEKQGYAGEVAEALANRETPVEGH
jgi:hypothetical protein